MVSPFTSFIKRCCMKPTVLTAWLLLFLLPLQAQHIRAFNNNVSEVVTSQGNTHNLFKVSFVGYLRKGFAIGIGYGLWYENPTLQYSLNTGVQLRYGARFLGNYLNGNNPKDSRSRMQVVFSLSPMLTIGTGEHVYQELEPFYLGTPNAVFNKFKYSLTLGTTFTTCPRGTYKNISTSRNRSQQIAMVALNAKNFNFTIYDDYLSFITQALQLGDNWDRFFTGGGFVRYRFNNTLTAHLYSEVYTGINRANAFLNPDIISYTQSNGHWHRQNFANQDPGQEYFNSSWLVAKITYSGPQVRGNVQGASLPSMDFFIGTSNPFTMFSQNFIHDIIPYDDANKLKFHHFLNRSNVPGNLEAGSFFYSLFVGAGIQSNISMY